MSPHAFLTAFQKQLREFLIAEQVRLPGFKKKGSLPACATQQEVANFCYDQSCRPHQDRVVMAWFQPLTSEWNTECIALLAQKAQSTFRASIASGKSPHFDNEWLSTDSLCTQIKRGLKYTKDKMTAQSHSILSSPPCSSNTPSLNKDAQKAARARRRPRKIQVMIIFCCT